MILSVLWSVLRAMSAPLTQGIDGMPWYYHTDVLGRENLPCKVAVTPHDRYLHKGSVFLKRIPPPGPRRIVT